MIETKTLNRIFESPCCNPFCIEGNVVWLKLTQGKETCIDLKNWTKVRHLQWFAKLRHGNWYAEANTYFDGKRRVVLLHRLILPGHRLVDHKDGCGLNNLEGNLRPATYLENARNRRPKEGLGVDKLPSGNFRAKIRLKGSQVHLGVFPSEPEASKAYVSAAKENFGDFCRL